MRKNMLAFLIALCLVISMIPAQAISTGIVDVEDVISEIGGEAEPDLADLEELPEGEDSDLLDGGDLELTDVDAPVEEAGELPLEESEETPGAQSGLMDAPGDLIFGTEPVESPEESEDAVDGEAPTGAEPVQAEEGVENPDDAATAEEPDAGAQTDGDGVESGDAAPDAPVDAEAERAEESPKANTGESAEERIEVIAGEKAGEAPEAEDAGEAEEAPEDAEGGDEAEDAATVEAENAATVEAENAEAQVEEATEEEAEQQTEAWMAMEAQLTEESQETQEGQEVLEALSVSQTSVTLLVNDTCALTSGGGSGSVTWTSENAGIASVDLNGVVTGVSGGTTRVVATDGAEQTATCEVTVLAPTEAYFESRTLSIGLGEAADLSSFASVEGLTLSTADSAIASVGADGLVTGVALGETRLTGASADGKQDIVKLVVKPAPTTISLPYKTLRIGKGDSVRIRPNLGDGASVVTCTSSKKKVVRVAKGGIVKGVRKGTAFVTVRTFNGLSLRFKVVVKGRPGRVTATPNPLQLGVGETYTLGYKTPKGTAGSVRFTGDNPGAFSVNEFTGEITGVAPGSGTVTLTTYNGKTATCAVNVFSAPTQAAFDPETLSVAKKKKVQLKVNFNAGAWSNVTYEVENPRIAKVSVGGVVTGLRVGQTVIRAKTFVPGLVAEATFTVMGPPSRVWVDQKTVGANVGQPFQLEPHIPAGSKTTFKYKSSNRRIATVSKDGLVTPKKKGKVKITITTHNKKKCTVTVKVANPGQVNAIKLNGDVPVLYVGDSWQVEYTVTPAGAVPALTWTSSDNSVATVSDSGLVQAVGYGQTTIKAVPANNASAALKFTLSVQTRKLTLDIPDRTTDIAGIPGNLAMIDNIRKSALSEISRLQSEGAINGDSASNRTRIVNAIFENYAFPWMTPSKQSYWKAANSENGAKDFKADRVYYGLPYISGSGANRHYSAAQALAEQRYTDSGQGYYVLNKGAYLNGKYVGNDCSGLVNVSIWGTSGAHVADRTADIAVSSAYKTVSFDAMLPGDLINKGSAHVVMFLYYASTDKTKIMIIENGGSEKGTNTVHCSIMNAASYQKSGYQVRRLATLD